MRKTSWVLLALLAISLFLLTGLLAAPGDITVTDEGITGATFVKKSVAFTLNGTNAVATSIQAVFPTKGGSVEGTLASAPAGTVTLSIYNSEVFSAVGQKDLVSEAFASQRVQTGLFEAVPSASQFGFMLMPAKITFSVVSSSTADTAITGTVKVTMIP